MSDDHESSEPHATGRGKRIAGTFGVGAFAFFLIKGILWLVGPALLAWWASS